MTGYSAQPAPRMSSSLGHGVLTSNNNNSTAAQTNGNQRLYVRRARPVSLPSDRVYHNPNVPLENSPPTVAAARSLCPTTPSDGVAQRRDSISTTAQCPCPCCRATSAHRLRNENFLVLSVIQMLCALAAVTLSCVAISQQVFKYELGAGLWSGSLMLAAGVHGVITSRRKSPCTLVTFLVLCILAAISACFLTCLSAAGLVMDNMRRVHTQHLVLHALLLIVGFLETAIAVATSVLCCKQVCCTSSLMMIGAAAAAAAAESQASVDPLAAGYCPGITPLSTGCYLLHTGSQGGTLLYLMPTPTGEEVPMLFSPPSQLASLSTTTPQGPTGIRGACNQVLSPPPCYSTLPRNGCRRAAPDVSTPVDLSIANANVNSNAPAENETSPVLELLSHEMPPQRSPPPCYRTLDRDRLNFGQSEEQNASDSDDISASLELLH